MGRSHLAFLLAAVVVSGSLNLSVLASAPEQAGEGAPAFRIPAAAGPAPLPAGPWPRGPLKGLIGAQGMEPAPEPSGENRAGQCAAAGTGGEGEGAASPRAGPDLSPVKIDYLGPNPAIAEFGAGAVGAETKLNVTVSNLGDLASGPVSVSIKVSDYFMNVVGSHTTSIPGIPAGASQVVGWSWTPAYSTVFSVNATATSPGDANPGNDVLLLSGLMAEKWMDLCNSESGWTGDLGAGLWHVASSIPNDPAPGRHSTPSAWHCGPGNTYEDGMDASLVTPALDLTRMNPNYYALFNFNYYGRSYQGSDRLDCYVSGDDGQSWAPLFATLSGGGAQGGWFSWVTHWIDYDGDGIVDPNEPHQDGLDVSRYIGMVIRIKFRFVSDGAQTDIGFYIDDLVLRGIENLDDVAVVSISSAGPERLGAEQAYTSTVRNLGQSLQPAFTARFNISDGTTLSQTVPSLQPGQSRDLSWKWTPLSAGDFTMECRIAPAQDEVPGDNSLWRPAHVAAAPADILLVDDDSGPGNNGGLRGYSGADVEGPMKEALSAVGFDCFLVANDGDGPSPALLRQYGLVIWLTGYDDMYVSRTGTLSAGDRENLAGYLDGGGRLWLVSFEAMWDTWTLRQDPGFVQRYLRVRTFDQPNDDDAGTPASLEGLEGDPVSGGLLLATRDPPADLWDKSDRIVNSSDAPGIFYQYPYVKDPLSGPFNALRFSGAFKLVFFAFEYSFIASAQDRALLADRVLRWLWGGPSLAPGAGGLSARVEPGGTVSLNLTLVNPEPREWQVETLGAGQPGIGWEARTTPSVANGTPLLRLGPLGAIEISLEVKCPPGEPAGKQVGVAVTAGLAGSPYAISALALATVLGVPGVSLECSEKVKPASGGSEAGFTVSVRNTGNFDNRVNLSLSGEAAGWARVGKDYLFLTAGGRAFVQVTASVPKEAPAGFHNLTLRGEALLEGRPAASVLELSVQVNATRNLRIEKAPTNSSVNMALSARAVLSVEVSNYGNQPETVTLALVPGFKDPQEWSLPEQRLELSAFEKQRAVEMAVGVPVTAPAGYYELSLRLSFSDGGLGDRRATTVNVLRPDLALDDGDLRCSAQRPGLNDSLEFTVMVRNLGGAEIRGVNVSFSLNGREIGRARIHEAILPQGAVQASLLHRGLLYGDNVLRAVADPDGSAPDDRRQNNVAETHIFGFRADLSAGAILFRMVGKGPAASNRTIPAGMVEVAAVVANRGAYCLDAPNIEVNITIDGRVVETRVVSVAANSESEAATLWVARPGTHRITIQVDPGGRLDETSEGNNAAELTVMVAGTTGGGASFPMDWILLLLGITALVAVAGAFAWQTLRARRTPPPEEAAPTGMRLYRVKAGHEVACGQCGKAIGPGEQYYKCGCDARYHTACAPSGRCPRCAGEEEE
jgi:uncharacterized membrane protein